MKKHVFIWLAILALVSMLASSTWAASPVVRITDGETVVSIPDVPDGTDILGQDSEPDNDGTAGDGTGTTGNRATGSGLVLGSDGYTYVMIDGMWVLYAIQVLVLLGVF